MRRKINKDEIPEIGRSLMGLTTGRPPMSTTTDGAPDKVKIALATKTAKRKLYCRKCQRDVLKSKFYSAVDPLDTNGYMSICMDCIKAMYQTIFQEEKFDIYNTLKRLCKTINVKYSFECVNYLKDNFEKDGKQLNDEKVFSEYKRLLHITLKDLPNEDKSLCYSYDTSSEKSVDEAEEFNEAKRSFAQVWGDGQAYEDYLYLENKYSEYCATHKSDSAAEKSLLRQISLAELDIVKFRNSGDWKETREAVKQLQDLMKTAAVDPSKTSMLAGGLAGETYSGFIKMTETTEPAELIAERNIWKDVDDIGLLFSTYVTRPVKNFITSVRDFSGVDDVDRIDDDYENIDSDMPSVEEGGE